MNKPLTASEMGKKSWESRKAKYTPEQLKELLSTARKGKTKIVLDKQSNV